MRTLLLTFILGMGIGSCEGAKEGEPCNTPSSDSSDCAKGLTCANCGRDGTICVKRLADVHGRFANEGEWTCERVKGVNESGEFQRGLK